jgi:hypothetical protein
MRLRGFCHVSSKELVAYGDGYLEQGRRAIVEEHLDTCPRCREQWVAIRDVERAIRDGVAPLDNPAGRNAVHARGLTGLRQGTERRSSPSFRSLFAASLALLFLVLLVWPSASEAGFPLGRFVRFGPVLGTHNDQEVVRGAATPQPEAAGPASAMASPNRLPFALERIDYSTSEVGRQEVLYRNSANLSVLLSQTPTGEESIVELVPLRSREVIAVLDVQVLLLSDPRPGAVAGVLWERKGVVFELLVTESPPEGLKKSDAVQLVETLIAAQDDVVS